jgi:hypothetical protein
VVEILALNNPTSPGNECHRLFATVEPLAHNTRMHRSLKGWEVIAVLTVCVCVIVGWMRWVDRPARRTYQAYVTLDGKGPWGLNDPPWDGPDALVRIAPGATAWSASTAFTRRNCMTACHQRMDNVSRSSTTRSPVFSEVNLDTTCIQWAG